MTTSFEARQVTYKIPPNPESKTPQCSNEEAVHNGGFNRKLQIFEKLASEAVVPQTKSKDNREDLWPSQTIRRRSRKTEDKTWQERKDCARLDVSPVRRKPSLPLPSKPGSLLTKRRVASDSDKDDIPVFKQDVPCDRWISEEKLNSLDKQATKFPEDHAKYHRQGNVHQKPPPRFSHDESNGCNLLNPDKIVLNPLKVQQFNEKHGCQFNDRINSRMGVGPADHRSELRATPSSHPVVRKPSIEDRQQAVAAIGSAIRKKQSIRKPAMSPKPNPKRKVVELIVESVPHQDRSTKQENVAPVAQQNRKSVLDMVGTFEGKNETRTLGRTRKSAKASDTKYMYNEASEQRGLSRRLSHSLGNIAEINGGESTKKQKWLPDGSATSIDEKRTNVVRETQESSEGNSNVEQELLVKGNNNEPKNLPVPPSVPRKPQRTFAQELHTKPKQVAKQEPSSARKDDKALHPSGEKVVRRVKKSASMRSTQKPSFAPPLPPTKPNSPFHFPQEAGKQPPLSILEIPTEPINKGIKYRPKSVGSVRGVTNIYATPVVEDAPQSHPPQSPPSQSHPPQPPYHTLEEHNALSSESNIFGNIVQSQTVEDAMGYAIPGSHMWGMHSGTTMDNIQTPQAPAKQTVPPSDSQPRSNNNAAPSGPHGYTEPTLSESASGQKEKTKPKVNKMRRKIHEAFKGKVKANGDRVSVADGDRLSVADGDRLSVASEDSDVDDEVTEKRLTAVRQVKARTSHYCSIEQTRMKLNNPKLYEYVVMVTLKYDETQRRHEPCEIRRFPRKVSDSQNDKLRAIPFFCFPDSFKWVPVESYSSETFSFVLTSFDGSRFYGYNRRLLPPGDGARLPEVFCVMSPVPCYPIYYQLLDEIERRRNISMFEVEMFLKEAYGNHLPRPGKNVRISRSIDPLLSPKEPLFLQRPEDSRLEHIDFFYLFKCLTIPYVLQIFGSLLLERRIVMFSSDLSKLSKCSQAIAALLYPFAWQHVYVPVLPQKLLDMCCSPTPYIMGMLSLCIPELDDMPLEEVLIVNIDAGEFDVHVGDEDTIIPRRLSRGLDKALQTCLRENMLMDNVDVADKQLSEDCETRNKAISEAFIHFFVELVGHYSNHFMQGPNGKITFDRESFVKGISSKSIKRFLEVFTETQMFSLFIQEKESESDEGHHVQSLFDQRIHGYETEKRNSKLLGVASVKKIGQKIAGTAKGVKVKVKAFDDKI